MRLRHPDEQIFLQQPDGCRIGYLVVLGGSSVGMVGLGEAFEEVVAVLKDLGASGVGIVTIGQYLRPSGEQLPVARFYTPDEFAVLRESGLRAGIKHVESGPLVRSSYHAHQQTASFEGPALRSHPGANL